MDVSLEYESKDVHVPKRISSDSFVICFFLHKVSEFIWTSVFLYNRPILCLYHFNEELDVSVFKRFATFVIQ